MRTRFRAARGRIETQVTTLRNPRSLGAKLLLILTAIGLAGSIAITLLLASVITPSFNRLEAKSVDGHIERTRAALHEYASKVESAVRDYGDWNSSYDYMGHPTRAFEAESFSPLAMENLGVNGMAYIANDGHIVIARWRGTRGDDAVLRAALVAQIARVDFRRALKAGSSASFYVRLGQVVAAIGIAEVRRSDGTGDPRGFVLMARQITSGQLSGLLQLGAKLDLADVADQDRITSSATKTRIAVPVYGVDHHAVASAAFTVPRDLSVLGRRMLLLAVCGSTVLLLIVLVMLRRMIDRLVLRPLARVERHMQMVRASGSLGQLAEDGRQDEIGSLGASFNAMLSQLQDLREQIEAQSFALGRSESAVAVMHNVRNALNPISTILSQGIAQAPPVDRAMLDRAVAELAREDLPATRRGKLVAFVAAAVEADANDRTRRRGELEIGREAMAHVLEIIGAQQRAAHERPDLEVCDVSEILARNATIARYSGDLSIAFVFPGEAHLVMASRVILSQVIGNLLGNAAEAIAATGTRSGTISATVSEEGGETRIAIRDDGEGFDPANAPTFFQRGFSTRAHKSGGLGLHWCANAMGAMQGALRLESEGRGRGAIAVLTLARVDGEVRVAA
ncbi:CHASE4 domain-containing protein [Sphingomonas sp. GC_Shp_3]|uniref:CHASE4 domain-containing protein n=1 Tax=Sphingomonas sp. GC_Shp_3 TaxID=2937383 RepID=UPI00226AEA03|nr:CHASE4 domain-containing protein [Sphingomonas sp. GC_Shp_3]